MTRVGVEILGYWNAILYINFKHLMIKNLQCVLSEYIARYAILISLNMLYLHIKFATANL